MRVGHRRSRPGWNFVVWVLGCLLPWCMGTGWCQPQSQDAREPTHGAWGDQGDGTYANPIMPGDFSDLDAIRVGQDFYAISSTFQYSPGVAVLHSKDLVNWKIAGHVVQDVAKLDPQLNWDTMGRSGRGIWAGAIRFHAGKYWVYFGTPDQGYFMSTAAAANGPWTPPIIVLSATGWDDPCPFWDDDGQGYLVGTHFAVEPSSGKAYTIHLFRMDGTGVKLIPSSDRIIHQSKGSEANKLYKIHGLYYHYFSQVMPEGRVAMMERAKSLDGPWEKRQLQHVYPKIDKEPNQGGLIQLADGRWYFVTHQGTGDWEGRAGVLLPVTWIDGWPILGEVGSDGTGKMVWGGNKPITGFPLTSLVADDTFEGTELKSAWEWNYQPRAEMWSLSERPGYLRLHAFPALQPGKFESVGNVLTQRSMRTRNNEVTVKLDVAGMVDGQESGLAHYAATYSTLSVVQRGKDRRLVVNGKGSTEDSVLLPANSVWLRSVWNFDGISHYSYSLDGLTFVPIGQPYQLTWGHYRGDRTGIFTVGPGGYLDVDSFRYEIER